MEAMVKSRISRDAVELLKFAAALAAIPAGLFVIRAVLQLWRGQSLDDIIAALPLLVAATKVTFQLVFAFETAIGEAFLYLLAGGLVLYLICAFWGILALV